MALNVAWTAKATEQLDRIRAWIGENCDENEISPFVRQVFKIVDLLSIFPEIGLVENKKKGIRGFLVSRNHRLFYRITNTKIIVIAIFDMRMDPKNRTFT